MLRTNQTFLNYLDELHKKQKRSDDFIVKSFSAGDQILVQDHQLSHVMMIKEGIVKCFLAEENGKEYIVEFLGSGEIIGEVELIKNINCLCSIEALNEVTAYAVKIPFFKALIKNDLGPEPPSFRVFCRANYQYFQQSILSTVIYDRTYFKTIVTNAG
ncbi:Crp/Fnr family transcriptional regulator [Chryseobacterium sp. R2ACT005]|uniref:Crp/Fnr family transcriptional regulator n=1 Tax=Chryseobacterium sp. R2ACT005 TaxID=3416668 RepID=UPI003CF37F93